MEGPDEWKAEQDGGKVESPEQKEGRKQTFDKPQEAPKPKTAEETEAEIKAIDEKLSTEMVALNTTRRKLGLPSTDTSVASNSLKERRKRLVQENLSVGLGVEANRQVAENLLSGNYAGLLDIIQTSEFGDIASDVVLKSMQDFHQKDRANSVNQLIRTALSDVDKYGDALKALVGHAYQKQGGERFFQNPDTGETLFVDRQGQLLSVRGEVDVDSQGGSYIKAAESYRVPFRTR